MEVFEYCIYGNLKKVVQYISINPSFINVLDYIDNTLLHIACKYDHIQIAIFLLEKKININAQNVLGNTALHLATETGNIEIICLLLKHRAKTNLENKYGDIPLHIACKLETTDSNLMNNYKDIIDIFMQKEDYIHTQSTTGRTFLHISSMYGYLDMMKFLLEKRIPTIDINIQDKSKNTPLHLACYNGRLDAVKFLLEKGANVNSKNKKNYSPLDYAYYSGNQEIIKILSLVKND